jgi:site-specific recombinase
VGLLLYLAQPGQKGNEAFLGIGVIGWVIIVVLIAVALFLFMRSRRRSFLDRLTGRKRRGF